MNKRIDTYTGAVFALISLVLIFIINPFAVDVPTASVSEIGSVTPRFFPNFASILMFIFSIFLLISSYSKKDSSNSSYFSFIFKDAEKRYTFFIRLLAMLMLLIFPFASSFLGIILSGFVLYILYAIFCGERNWLQATFGSITCILILYYFFVKIASVPLPLGFIDNFL
jgi:hypothetical protein